MVLHFLNRGHCECFATRHGIVVFCTEFTLEFLFVNQVSNLVVFPESWMLAIFNLHTGVIVYVRISSLSRFLQLVIDLPWPCFPDVESSTNPSDNSRMPCNQKETLTYQLFKLKLLPYSIRLINPFLSNCFYHVSISGKKTKSDSILADVFLVL